MFLFFFTGYYADMETSCQVWHWCLHSGQQFDFLCPNGTVFNQVFFKLINQLAVMKSSFLYFLQQDYRVCDWFYNVDCAKAEDLYLNNEELYKDAQGNPI
jgi:Chitin binding Peritrophin-A domain